MTSLDTGAHPAVTAHSMVLTVTDVVGESHDARSLVFAVPNEYQRSFSYRPGQFLTVRVPSDTTGAVARCYSLASSPHTDSAPKVTIKRTVGGYGSNWLCDNISAGDTLEVLPPSGGSGRRRIDPGLPGPPDFQRTAHHLLTPSTGG